MQRLSQSATKVFLVAFVVMFMVFTSFSFSHGVSTGITHKNDSIGAMSTSNIANLPSFKLDNTSHSARRGKLLRSLVASEPTQLRHNLSGSQSSGLSGKLYKVTFIENGLSPGMRWEVGVLNYTQYSMTTPFLGPDFALFGDILNISNYDTLNSTTGNSISVYLGNGSYSYVAGVGSTYTCSNILNILGMRETINISFPQFYKVTIEEKGLPHGTEWNLEAKHMAIMPYYYNYTTRSCMVSYLPNGTYEVSAGPRSTFIQNDLSFTVSGHNKNVEVKFPAMYKITFTETNLYSGSRWFVESNISYGSVLYLNSSYDSSMVGYLPQGKYSYKYFYPAFEDETNTSELATFAQSFFYIQPSVQSHFTITDRTVRVSAAFASTYKVTFTKSNVPAGVFYSLSLRNDSLCAVNCSSYNTMIAYLPNGTYSYSGCYKDGPLTVNLPRKEFEIKGTAKTVGVTFPRTYEVILKETNAPAVGLWGLSLRNKDYSVIYSNFTASESMIAYLPNGTYYYAPYFGRNSYRTENFEVEGHAKTVNVKFPKTYKVLLNETNVPTGVSWSACVYTENFSIDYQNGTTSASMITYLPNGTYNYFGYFHYRYYYNNYLYSKKNKFTVYGSSLVINVEFPAIYSATFRETNIPNGTPWSISLYNQSNNIIYSNRTSSSSIVVYLPNGSYSYVIATPKKTYGPYTSTGVFTVYGAPVSVSIVFSMAYSVSFTEIGLPSGVPWSVTINGATKSSTTNTITVSLFNGTYAYSIVASDGIYESFPYVRNLTVNGTPVSESIVFSRLYSITFTATGLPSGTYWSLTFDGKMYDSYGNMISYSVPNGTYSYTIGNISGYSASKPSGIITVNGDNLTVSLSFRPIPRADHSPGSSASAFSHIVFYIVIAAAVVAAVIGVVAVIITVTTRLRRRK